MRGSGRRGGRDTIVICQTPREFGASSQPTPLRRNLFDRFKNIPLVGADAWQFYFGAETSETQTLYQDSSTGDSIALPARLNSLMKCSEPSAV